MRFYRANDFFSILGKIFLGFSGSRIGFPGSDRWIGLSVSLAPVTDQSGNNGPPTQSVRSPHRGKPKRARENLTKGHAE